MRYSVKSRLLIGAVGALGALAFAAAPASAAPGSFTLAGSGTYSPGLTLAGNAGQTLTYSGSGYGTSGTYIGPINCTWTGFDAVGSLSQGTGSFSGTCTTLTGTESVSGNYARSFNAVTIDGRIGPAPFIGSYTATCAWAAGPPPSTSYQQNCTFTVQ